MITKEEYLELKELYNNGYRWIARDICEIIYAYKLEPIKLGFSWKYSKNNIATTCGDDFLLPYVYVKWEDEKPTKILDLIRDYESHQIITGGNNVNKSELIKEIEEILDDIGVSDYELGECDEDTIWTISSITIREILSAIEKYSPVSVGENVKVTIPQFVADWIEEVKGLERRFKLEHLCDTLKMPNKVYDWLDEQECTTDILARAWLDGFIVNEDEPLYYALIKGHELSSSEFKYWSCNAYNSGDLFIGSKYPKASCINRMTKTNWNKLGINESNADFVKLKETE